MAADRGESSRIIKRPQSAASQDYLSDGDTLVVCALDRVTGTEPLANEKNRNLGFPGDRARSLQEPFLGVEVSVLMG